MLLSMTFSVVIWNCLLNCLYSSKDWSRWLRILLRHHLTPTSRQSNHQRPHWHLPHDLLTSKQPPLHLAMICLRLQHHSRRSAQMPLLTLLLTATQLHWNLCLAAPARQQRQRRLARMQREMLCLAPTLSVLIHRCLHLRPLRIHSLRHLSQLW